MISLRPRGHVLWIGMQRRDLSAFSGRGLTVYPTTIDTAKAEFPSARACIMTPDPKKYSHLISWIQDLTEEAIDHGLTLKIALASDAHHSQVAAIRKSQSLGQSIEIISTGDTEAMAESIARHEPGPSHSQIKITGAAISPITTFMLSRAFYDCAKIEVVTLPGGRVADGVFCVHAWYSNSLVGPRPLPFFAKLDTRSKITGEMWNYAEYADHFIPFNLRPNLVHRRCIVGYSKALMVGNFVENAVSLRTSLRGGNVQGPIYSIFDHGLEGLRLQTFANNLISTNISSYIVGRALPEKVTAKRIELAKALGSRKTPLEIVAALELRANIRCREAPNHGDLHDGNIMVRGGDAILIDFSSIGNGPLSADPASLEVSLVFNSGPEDEVDFESWKCFVDLLYDGPCDAAKPPLCDPSHLEWLWTAVRQIRLVGTANLEERREYPLVLAAHLLRFGRLPSDGDSNPTWADFEEKRHAYALVVAEHIAFSI